MRYRVVFLALVVLVLIPANVAQAACEFSGRDVVYPGVFSSEWEATADIEAFNSASGFPVTFGGSFHSILEGRDNTYWILDQVWQAHATPVANIEVPVSAETIASGAYDEQIRAWVEGLAWWLGADSRRAVILAPMQEMNGDWVQWGMDPENFKLAYRRFVEIVREYALDETQVRWMFAPNGVSVFPYSVTDYWPGDDVVDIVGLSAYNFGHEFGQWQDVDDVLFDATEQLRAFARDKPFIISQIATSPEGGNREVWLSEMFDFVADHPNHVGFVYFNFDKESNWTVWDGDNVAAGWLDALEDPRVRHEFPIDEWFRPGRIPFSWSPSTSYPKPSRYCTEVTVSNPAQFDDVPAGVFYTLPVQWLASVGLTKGYEDGTFRPEQPVTRAEAITLLWRTACAPSGIAAAPFEDVAEQPFEAAVAWAVASEIATGYPDGTFRPHAEITRAEIATLIWRMHDCGAGSRDAVFFDVPFRSYFGGAVDWMSASGITSGVQPGEFGSSDSVTRGELATLLFRMPQG